MRIAFFASNIVPIHARSLEERPLGGTETGLIRLAEALQQLGHEVLVYTPHENPPPSSPQYLPHRSIESCPPVDVFISIRDWIPLLYRVQARLRMLWTGDSYDQFSNWGLGDLRVSKRIDYLLTVSQWQADRLSESSGFPRAKAWVLGNGVELSFFKGTETRYRKRLIYSSTPHRGLIYVPTLLTELRKKHPEAECHIFSSYKVYDQEGVRNFEDLRAVLEKTPGCVLHGSVRQSDLAREFMKSSLLFYPCDYEETSCITAMEAQAAGCAIVSSDLAALSETVGDSGILLPGRPSSASYQRAYIEACDRVLSDDSLFEKFSKRGLERSQTFSWSSVAKRFDQFLLERLTQPQATTGVA